MGFIDRIKRACGFGPRLNCKPGDLCRVIDHPGMSHLERNQLVGMIVKVTTTITHPDGHPCWLYEGDPITVELIFGRLPITGIADMCLRPIRNPGDEEVDEVLALTGPAPAADKPQPIPAPDVAQV
jgi:hypothetical protein